MKKYLSAALLLAIISLIAFDASFRFDLERVTLKRQHQSAQRHWSWFYKQDYVYHDGAIKYREEINHMGSLIEPGKLLLSDIASSYYVAAELPIYVKNTHVHHRKYTKWSEMIDGDYFCYLDNQESLGRVKEFIADERSKNETNRSLELKYWLVNFDPANLNLRYDCLATRAPVIAGALHEFAKPIFQGNYLLLFELD